VIYSDMDAMLKTRIEGGNGNPIILDPPRRDLSRLIRGCSDFDLEFWHYFLLYRGFKLIRAHKTFLIYIGNAPGVEIWANLCGHYDSNQFSYPYFRKIYRFFKNHESGKNPPAREKDWWIFSCWITGIEIKCKETVYQPPYGARGAGVGSLYSSAQGWKDFFDLLRILTDDPKFLPLYLHHSRFGILIKEALSSELINATNRTG